MKKLKILLMLGILLCFGFALSSEVHAQEPSYPTNVVVFKSDSPRTITPKFTQSGVTLQYSIDNGSTWTNISSGVATASSDEIWFRGRATDVKSLYTSSSSSNAWVFSGDVSNKLHVYGDLRYLLCDNLGDNTIIFNIASYCFSYMFGSCTSLTTAPSLPATTLADYCYSNMFRGCANLTTAPSLPATTLADNCYRYMFFGCTGLTTAPSLPATTLVDNCYRSMFSGCTGLTTAPSLPATTLVDNCYRSMFSGCTAFKVSDTKGGSYQYSWRIPTSGTGTTATDWNTDMLYGTGGPFTDNPTIDTTYYVENPPVSGFNITFEENGGSSVTDLSEQTSLPDPLPTPTKEGYTFVGWYYDPAFFNEDKAFAGDPLTDDVTLYARWLPGKLFEKDEVLPATTELKIRILFGQGDYHVETVDPSGIYLSIDEIDGDLDLYVKFGGLVKYDGEVTASEIDYTVDISNWSASQRTIKSVSSENGTLVIWEDLNPAPTPSGYSITFEENGGSSVTDLSEQTSLPDPLPTPTKEGYTFVGWYYDPAFFNEDKAFAGDPLTDDVTLYARWLPGKLFEKDEVLPATTELKIRILFGQGDYHVETVDPSGIYLSIDEIDGDLDLYVKFGGLVKYDGEVTASEIDYTVDISNWSASQRTIKSVSSDNGCIVTWEDATPDGYTQGYLTAREEYGYYDPITNQWLSVEEYLELYGTDKMDQSDFYGNFDKYFIPAMIIVFGGAIVLTILKVFKGRE